jgi:hypothetical protein
MSLQHERISFDSIRAHIDEEKYRNFTLYKNLLLYIL